MSVWATAMVAAKNAVAAPMMAMTQSDVLLWNSSGLIRTMR